MAINNIADIIRNPMCDAYVDGFDTGATDPGGDLDIYTAAFGALLVSPTFGAPAFGAAAAGVATANAITDGTATGTGTAAVVRFTDRANTTHSEGTVAAGSGDIDLNTVSIVTNDIVAITSGTITMPAS